MVDWWCWLAGRTTSKTRSRAVCSSGCRRRPEIGRKCSRCCTSDSSYSRKLPAKDTPGRWTILAGTVLALLRAGPCTLQETTEKRRWRAMKSIVVPARRSFSEHALAPPWLPVLTEAQRKEKRLHCERAKNNPSRDGRERQASASTSKGYTYQLDQRLRRKLLLRADLSQVARSEPAAVAAYSGPLGRGSAQQTAVFDNGVRSVSQSGLGVPASSTCRMHAPRPAMHAWARSSARQSSRHLSNLDLQLGASRGRRCGLAQPRCTSPD